MNAVVETTSNKPALERHAHDSQALAAAPKYFPDSLDLPLDPDHKTWHTERRCPTLLAQALKSERLAIFIAQLHYWLEKEGVGVHKHGFHWIYNAEWEWQEQFPWLSKDTIGRMRRKLEKLGYVVSNDFNRNPFNRTKHSTLDYYRLAVETGWNPMGLDLNRDYPHPPQFTKGIRLRGRHKSDSVPLVYSPVEPDDKETPKPNEIVDSARLQNASCTSVTMHSAQLQVSSIYKEIPNISKSNQETDLKIEPREGSQDEGSIKLLGKKNRGDTQLTDGLKAANSQISESKSPDPSSAPILPDNDEAIEAAQQFVASLNAKVELADRYRNHDVASSRPIRISGLDESAHEVLWKHQELLEQLNADLHAQRIHKAIADNPQHLEDAILAFIENSATGAKTKEAATGFLYNALCQGWKPRQSCSSAKVQVYTPPPQMLEPPTPPTLEELVEIKRKAWQNAPILRDRISAWVMQNRGVIMTADGPALESATNQPSQIDSEPKAASSQGSKAAANPNPPEDETASPKLEPLTQAEVTPNQVVVNSPPQLEGNSADKAASKKAPPPLETTAASAAFVLPKKPLPGTPPQAKQKPPSNRQLQPVEILTSAGEWIAGYFVHNCIAVANLVGVEQKFTLFNADGEMCLFWGQIRPIA